MDRREAGNRVDSCKRDPTYCGLDAMTNAFSELAVQFGRSQSLVGILSRPASELPVRRPAVVILNTGIAHRIGHHRMYVKMARDLAALGHLAFRFDFSGIGDSASRGDGLSPIEAHKADLAEALDWLTASFDVNEVVLIGLCAGAEIALRYGYSDKRVLGLVLLDPTIPPTVRFYAHYIGRRITQLRSWWSFVSGRGRIFEVLSERARTAFGAPAIQPAGDPDQAPRSDLEQWYMKSLDRNLKMLIVLTGGPLEGRQSYREQLFDALPNVPFQGRVTMEHFQDADHTFTPESARGRLHGLILNWVKTFPIVHTPSSPSEVAASAALGECPGHTT
jgi:pimeloyl-ACP methyl ester carboxylesterase